MSSQEPEVTSTWPNNVISYRHTPAHSWRTQMKSSQLSPRNDRNGPTQQQQQISYVILFQNPTAGPHLGIQPAENPPELNDNCCCGYLLPSLSLQSSFVSPLSFCPPPPPWTSVTLNQRWQEAVEESAFVYLHLRNKNHPWAEGIL